MKNDTTTTRRGRILGKLMMAALAGALVGGAAACSKSDAEGTKSKPSSSQKAQKNGCGGPNGCGAKADKGASAEKKGDKAAASKSEKNACGGKDGCGAKDKKAASDKSSKNSCGGKNGCA